MRLFTIIIISLPFLSFGQNQIVPDPGFENTSSALNGGDNEWHWDTYENDEKNWS